MILARWSVHLTTVGTFLFAVAVVPCGAQEGSPTATPEMPRFSEIVIPPLPEAFTSSTDPKIRRIVEEFEEIAAFEDLIFDPAGFFEDSDVETSTKSSAVTRGVVAPRAGCVEYSPDTWVEDCEPVVRPGVLSCRYYRYNGSLCVEWFDHRTPFTWMTEARMDGTSGSTTYDNFVVQTSAQNSDLKYSAFSRRQHIEHSSFDQGFVDGPLTDVEFLVEGEATLYTPSGKQDLSTRVIKTRHHKYDQFEREFVCDHASTFSAMPNDAYHVVTQCLNLDNNELYTCYVAYWKEGKGGWMTFDKDGRLTDEGKIEGMPP